VIEVKRKGVSVKLKPATLEGVTCLYVDVVKAVGNCGVPVFLFLRGRLWLVKAVAANFAASTESFKADA